MEVEEKNQNTSGLSDMASPDATPSSDHSQNICVQSSHSLSTDPHKHMLDDSDSDLTELSDIEMNDEDPYSIGDNKSSDLSSAEDIKPIINKRKPSPSLSEDSDADSEYEAKPTKKKAKKRSSTAKSSKGKGKLKKNKGKKVVDPDESVEEEVKPKKKVVLAKEVHWKDIPDWGDRTDCPLLQLPADILDMCFGLNTSLGVRDYIALAGVSKYFRHHFTPDIFHSICWSKGVHSVSRYSASESKIVKPETPSLANHIFNREVDEWRQERPKTVYKYGDPFHYIPAGSREDWSEAQYIVYKEEQAKWRKNERAAKVKSLELAIEIEREDKRKRDNYAIMGRQSRRVLAAVIGRKNGQPPVEKDEKGLPKINAKKCDIDADNKTESVVDHVERVNKDKRHGRKAKLTKAKRWTVPDTDDEKEYEILPHEYIPENEVLIFDFWPNKWRDLAVNWIGHKRINKSEAMRVYKVTDAELLCLKHLLVTNPMSAKNPQQAYLEAAVEALALRSHGGTRGHKDYIQARFRKSREMAQKRQAKIEKAKKDGTYVYTHKKRKVAPYDWWYRNDFWEYNGYCESECEACYAEEHGHGYSDYSDY
ncbi:hypothetical protein I302_103671 [Kwoniella bestiolae CBS 10118]|uniref:Uncharacterized protein n=1 Tax=Kwoniella bestiolae CBS 10118 TaxID=1296100 RepID=A0A1B9G905_9TREE|nr:hypothetical protein I302_02376 [Kwoniella bestiolae CBS 10118]OCF27534.1 hypothetical protein I302_02376 [Kwoniella bestiolae CBS 10118]